MNQRGMHQHRFVSVAVRPRVVVTVLRTVGVGIILCRCLDKAA